MWGQWNSRRRLQGVIERLNLRGALGSSNYKSII
jgi:hypothetical protein